MTGIFDQVKEKKESAFLAGIKQRAAALNKHIVLPEGEDVRVVRAAAEAAKQKIARITLLGKKDEIKRDNPGVDLSAVEIVDPATSEKRTAYAQLLFSLRKAKGMTEEEAKDELNDKNLGMRVSGREASDKYDEGEIISQDPGDGEMVDEHTTIEVVVSTGPETKTTIVPEVVKMEEAAAEKAIEDAKLVVKKDSDFSDDIEEGRVMSVSPDEGSEVEEGTEVTIVISLGPEQKKVSVPQIVGKQASDAEAALRSAGLVGSASEQYSDKPAGEVISQSPESGEVAQGSTVSYVVSLGPETKTVSVPNLTAGMTQEQAEQALKDAGLSVGQVTQDYSSSITPGYVMNQTISPGSEVAEGTSVGFTVSLGPETPGGDTSDGDSETENTN